MSSIKTTAKKRIILILAIFFLLFGGLIGRLAFIQIINSNEYRQKAMEQWTRDIPIPSKRGIIFDRNQKELAVSATAYEIYARPVELEDKEAVADILAKALSMDKKVLTNKLNTKKDTVVIKKKVNAEIVKALREKEIKGLIYIDDSKRFYTQSNFASYILGFTNLDNQGQDGVELTYEKYLNGFPGRYITMTDAHGKVLPDSDTKSYNAQDGLNLVLTVDKAIQHFAEKAVENAAIENKAKRVTAIVMDPKTGDILALAVKPDYDNNDPRKPPVELMDKWDTLSYADQYKELFKIWRNPAVSDIYEPGSTFKIITSAAGLEENVVKTTDQFNCTGSVVISGTRMKCWRSDRPHGAEDFIHGVQNSCNPVFIEVAQRLGAEKFYKYIKAFGFGTLTNVKLPGEAPAIVRSASAMGPVETANIGFGQGITVTPMQLITAVSSVANGGYLMEPRIAKRLVDNNGNVVHEFQPKIVRQVISKQTSDTMRSILESVVYEGTGKSAYLPGYKVAGKTGTAQKAENGRYVAGKYVSSFIGFAPANDPKVIVLVVIDEPGGISHFGGVIATPVVKSIIYDTMRYMNIEPQYTEEEKKQLQKPKVLVPEVRNMNLQDAMKALSKSKLKYYLEAGESVAGPNALVIDQTPKAGAEINEGSSVIVFVKSN